MQQKYTLDIYDFLLFEQVSVPLGGLKNDSVLAWKIVKSRNSKKDSKKNGFQINSSL